ncbi:type II toxin-antitoxin system HicB family antitoxin [Gemmatimonadota bacterium]
MRTFTAIVERDPETRLFVGYVPGFAGAHSQGASLDELNENLREVIAMLLEDGCKRSHSIPLVGWGVHWHPNGNGVIP